MKNLTDNDFFTFLNPIAATMMMMGENMHRSKQKFKYPIKKYNRCLARYIGKTEYYDKVSNCPPVLLKNGDVYIISSYHSSSFPDYNNGLDIVRVYDLDEKYLTWIPYAVNFRLFWEIL